MKTLNHILIALAVSLAAGAPVHAETNSPITVAPFTLSDAQLTCPNCLSDWRVILKNALKPIRPEGSKISGAVALVDLSDPRVVVMTSKEAGTKECRDRKGIATGYEALGEIPLPIRLRIAEEWARKIKLDLALNANPFKAAPAKADEDFICGSVTGPYVTSGVVEWPPIERKDMLAENVSSDPARPTWALTIHKDNRVLIRQIKTFTQLQNFQHVIAGEPLFIGYTSFPSGEKSAKQRISRLGVGFLPGRQQILIIHLADRQKDGGADTFGFPQQVLTTLFRSFGAMAALELPGGDHAQLASKDGLITAQKNPPTPQPVAVHLGFRLKSSNP